MTLVGACLARNEAGRYLRRVLMNAASLCDKLLVLDDGSTDDTAAVARELGADVTVRPSTGWWGGEGEGSARAELWKLAAAAAGPTGWVYVFDADHELMDVTRSDMRALASAEHVTSWAWPLMDCWDSDQTHRVDGMWQAWRSPRPWLARGTPGASFVPEWPAKALHVGHFPANYPHRVGLAPGWIRHLGYVNPADRELKARRYLDEG